MKLNPIASNMTEVEIAGNRVLFSYQTPVAAYISRYSGEYAGGWYRTDKQWSRTTSKHINRWLNGEKARTVPQSFFDTLTA